MTHGRAAAVAALLACAACHGVRVPPARVLVSPAPREASPIAKALHFLASTQVGEGVEGPTPVDLPGSWPHEFVVEGLPLGLRPAVADLTCGTIAQQHHALALLRAEHAAVLGLTPEELAVARRMRRAARALVDRFASPSAKNGAPVFGWWIPSSHRQTPTEAWFARILARDMRGPPFHGVLFPPGLPCLPGLCRLWPDSDDTALAHLCALDDADVDGGAPFPGGIASVLASWRDVGREKRRFPDWLPSASGCFQTWIEHPPDAAFPNEVDLGVNANVLCLLGRLDALDTPGAPEATAAILAAVRAGRHRDAEDVSLYYPENLMFHWLVIRAWANGRVGGLAEAALALADDVERRALLGPDGTARWGRRDTHLATAHAVLALTAAGRGGPLVDGGVLHLLRTQDPVRGGWPAATYTYGRSEGGHTVSWRSAAFPTSMAVHALAAAAIARGPKSRVPVASAPDSPVGIRRDSSAVSIRAE